MRNEGLKLAGLLTVLWALWAGVTVAKGGLLIGKHEGDAMHLADIVLRQAAGQWPHLDFMTPIGLLATWPIAGLVQAGMGLGAAVMAAQALVALVLVPAVWWIGVSRLGVVWGSVLGAVVIGLTCAVVHGEAERSLSISMHYNRWAWAVAFCVLTVAAVPPRRPGAWGDGLVLGLGVAALALTKVTYVVALLPALLVALALSKDLRAAAVALGAGLGVAVAVTVAAGVGFWGAYIGDLLATSQSEIRSAPGDSLGGVVAAPAYLGGTLAAVVGVVLLRRSGQERAGGVLLIALPGVFYITFQNFGNDPQWLYLFAVLFLALRPLESGLRVGLGLAGFAAALLAAPSAMNVASSPVRHLLTSEDGYRPLLPRHGDLMIGAARAEQVAARVSLPGFEPVEAAPTVFNGEALEGCRLEQGTVALYERLAAEVATVELNGRPVMTADLFNALWLYADVPPLEGGAPWYYGGLPGGDAAELLLVPRCPVLPPAQRAILAEIDARGWTLTEVAREEMWILAEIERP